MKLSTRQIKERNIIPVKKEIIKWQFEIKDVESPRYLPQMETDITLENDTEKIIIDAKYYSETMAVNYDREKIKSANLYQLFSYLINQQSHEPKTQTTKGILLYPTIDADYDLHYQYQRHDVWIRTVNLNTNWMNISKRLKEIAGC